MEQHQVILKRVSETFIYFQNPNTSGFFLLKGSCFSENGLFVTQNINGCF